MTDTMVIVGAGHNGLVCAFYLARAGLAVEVIEARPVVGGACVTEELIPGFRFSTCANVLCWLRPEIARDMRLAERGVQWPVAADPVYECFDTYSRFLPDGSTFTWHRDSARMEEEVLGPWVLLTDGNIHHVDVHPSQMPGQRPLPELARYAAPLPGLYLCGAGQHPYGEVTGAPGHNAAARILADREAGAS